MKDTLLLVILYCFGWIVTGVGIIVIISVGRIILKSMSEETPPL